ncbi:MAG: acyl-CoA/acyl-ACP dehydrogenase [Acidimicrobiia bacterium]|nr:acyl-CoA/acyl-ACP dehydrogenase [Acidimicrobiia bacterium]
MNFDLTEDQRALRDGIRALCVGRFGMERVRAGFDRSMFAELAETGVFSLRSDGFTWSDASIAFQELGRALVPGPLVWSHLAHGTVEGIVTGVERPADGRPAMIEHLAAADTVVVIDAGGVNTISRTAFDRPDELGWPLDPLTPVHRVEALPEAEPIGDAAIAEQWTTGGAVLTAAYQVGMAEACVAAATEYSLERRQFDRPIGSFQAVKHILADMAVRAEVARAAADAAAVTLDDPEIGDVARVVSGARLLASEAALKNAKASMQVHGGMGFTWEVDVHLYLKRAWVLNTVFGTPNAHADALAATLTPISA